MSSESPTQPKFGQLDPAQDAEASLGPPPTPPGEGEVSFVVSQRRRTRMVVFRTPRKGERSEGLPGIVASETAIQ